jgi:drug/metabolite transporter (DMT)-like permease
VREWSLATAAGGLLALHFATWITSLQFTSVAASVLLVNTAPVFVAVLLWLVGQRPGARTWVAVALGLAGALVIAAPAAGERGSLLGNLLAIGGALAMAAYLLLAREAQRGLPYLPYVAVAYGTAAATLWVAVLWTGTGWWGFAPRTWGALGAMALVSQLVGHGGYNWSLRHLHPAFVSIALTGEPVLAALLAWWLLDEPVTPRIAAGGLLVLGAIVVAARPSGR